MWLMVWLILLLVLFVLHGVLLSIFVLLEQRQPVATLAWILILLLLPVFGALFYYFFGRMRFVRRQRLRARALTQLDLEMASLEFYGETEGPISQPLDVSVSSLSGTSFASEFGAATTTSALDAAPRAELTTFQANEPLITLALRTVDMPLSYGNRLSLLNNADPTYEAIRKAIEQARHHVHVSYYILNGDETGKWFRGLLIERAKAGIEVRLLYDWIGSYDLTTEFLQPLLDAGVKCAAFLPLRFSLAIKKSQLNFRNHRKIVIVDGKIGFTGGINIGDEYRGLNPKIGFWRDIHAQIEGPAVRQLQQVFVEDWCYTTQELLVEAVYYPQCPNRPGEEMVQMISSGPDHPWYSIRLLFFLAISSAHEKVWITTPYFIPDDSILTALTTAALRGIDVRLLLPAFLDHKLVLYAGRSYYRELLRAGVRIYEYNRGMLHAKTMVVDGRCGTIGSANMDIRSFHLNFELNAFVYSEPFAQALEKTFLEDIQQAEEIDLITFVGRPLSQKLAEASSRLLSPLL